MTEKALEIVKKTNAELVDAKIPVAQTIVDNAKALGTQGNIETNNNFLVLSQTALGKGIEKLGVATAQKDVPGIKVWTEYIATLQKTIAEQNKIVTEYSTSLKEM